MEQEIEVVDMPMELSVFDPLDVQIAEAKAKNESIAFDYHDKQGNKDARSWLLVLRKLKAPIVEMHRTGKAEALAYCKKWDDAKKKRIAAIEEMIDYHHAPIKEIEDTEAAKKAEAERIAQEKLDAEEAARIAEIVEREKAAAAKEAELKAKQEEFDRKERESSIAEEARKQAEEDARQAVVDATNAKFAAEATAVNAKIAAEVKAKQAAINAENRRIADVQREKDKAAADVVERERVLAKDNRTEEIESARLRKQKTDAAANVEHRSQIHRAIYGWLLAYRDTEGLGLGKALSEEITHWLIDGKIPHTSINY